MRKTEMKRFVMKHFPELEMVHKFAFLDGTNLARVSEYVLQGICFALHSGGGFALTPYVIPIVYPCRFPFLTLGGRVGGSPLSDGRVSQFYDMAPDRIEETIALVRGAIQEVCLPYLSESCSIESIADPMYQAKWRRFWGEHSAELKAYVAAFAGRWEDFRRFRDVYCRDLKADDPEWVKLEVRNLNRVEEALEDPVRLRAVFHDFAKQSIEVLKLEKLGAKPPPLLEC